MMTTSPQPQGLAITSQEDLTAAQQSAALVLFGGAHCGVCQVLQPKIAAMLAAEFPKLALYTVDCHGAASALCAQASVYALPVVQLWFQGQKHAEFGRVFGLAQLRAAIARPYAWLLDAGA